MEKKEKKVRVKKARSGKKVSFKERLGSLFFTVLALGIAMVVFAGFMLLQSVFSENIIYKEVLVVVQEIPENEILTEENVQLYFGTKRMNELDTTEGAATPEQLPQLVGMKTRVPLHVGEEVTATDFANTNVYLDCIEDPVEMSIETGGISGTDGGKIRAGDIVNITMMFTKEQLGIRENASESSTVLHTTSSYQLNQDDKEEPNDDGEASGDVKMGNLTKVSDTTSGYNFEFYAKYMLENIYIKDVLTSDGQQIAPTDKDTTAGIFIVVVPKRIELQLNNILSNCSSMRISKVMYEISPDDLFKDSSLVNNISALSEIPSGESGGDGWTEPDETGYRYKPLGGNIHLKWVDAGITMEEQCEYGDGTTCIHCHSERYSVPDGSDGDEAVEPDVSSGGEPEDDEVEE